MRIEGLRIGWTESRATWKSWDDERGRHRERETGLLGRVITSSRIWDSRSFGRRDTRIVTLNWPGRDIGGSRSSSVHFFPPPPGSSYYTEKKSTRATVTRTLYPVRGLIVSNHFDSRFEQFRNGVENVNAPGSRFTFVISSVPARREESGIYCGTDKNGDR